MGGADLLETSPGGTLRLLSVAVWDGGRISLLKAWGARNRTLPGPLAKC